jgi:NHL repeat-containing protein
MRRAQRLTTAMLATLGVLSGGLALSSAPAVAAEQWSVISTFGGASSAQPDPEPLSDPAGVAVNQATGDVYVVDKGNNRVEYFDSAGKYLGQFNGGGKDVAVEGKAAPAGRFSEPEGIAVDSDLGSPSFGDVYVVDFGHSVIDKFSSTGAYLDQLTPVEAGAELFGVAVDSMGSLWVWETAGEPTHELSGLIDEFSDAPANISLHVFGHELGEWPARGLAVDSNDNLYVGEAGGEPGDERRLTLLVAKSNSEFGQEERLDAEVSTAIAVDLSSDDVYIDNVSAVSVFGSSGSPLERFGAGALFDGSGMAVDSASGDVYVAEPANNRVFVFQRSATPQEPPPAPATDPASEVTGTSAVLNGELNPGGVAGGVGYYFSYNIGAGSSCTGPGSVRTPFDDGAANVTAAESVSATVKLHPHREYVFCLLADKFGATAGLPVTLTTGGVAPEVIAGSESASNVSPFEGQLTAVINPDEEATTYSFEYSTEGSVAGNTLAGVVQTASGAEMLPAEFAERTVNVKAHEAEPAATYYYRVVARNGTGTVRGNVEAYTKPPIIESESASAASSSVNLEATVNPDFQPTTYAFEYATSEAAIGTASATKVTGSLAAEAAGLPVSAEIFSLQPGHTYYYRVVAENGTTIKAGKPVDGTIHPFTLFALPAVTIGEAQSIIQTSATLSGTVNPEGAETTYYFEYVSEAGYQAALARGAANPYAEAETTAPVNAGSSYAEETIAPTLISGLLPGETYHYALVATNRFEAQATTLPRTLTTLPGTPPTVTTGAASAISQNSATLSGTVSTNSLQTEYGFEIGTEPGNYGPATGLGSIGGALSETVTVTVNELQPGTTYYYRVTARSADGASYGEPETFATPGFPALLTTPSSPPLIGIPGIAFPTGSLENTGTTIATKQLTRAQKLAAALKACHTRKGKKRTECEKQAKAKYATTKKKARK